MKKKERGKYSPSNVVLQAPAGNGHLNFQGLFLFLFELFHAVELLSVSYICIRPRALLSFAWRIVARAKVANEMRAVIRS